MIWIVEYGLPSVGPTRTERVKATSIILAWAEFRRRNPDIWINAIVRADD